MLTQRYIQAVITHDIAEGIKQGAIGIIDKCERAIHPAEQREQTDQLTFRFVDLDRRFGI